MADARRPLTPALAQASRAVGVYGHLRYRILFGGLLLTLMLAPIQNALGLDVAVLQVFIAANLVVAATGISQHPGWRVGLVAAAMLAGVFRLVPEEALAPWLVMGSGLLWIVIAVLATAAAVRFALRATRVDSEHVAAALSAYLLAGLLFAVLYVLVEYRWPGSVVEVAGGSAGPLTVETAVYYSYVTLATLGYGDVVPRGVARGLAVTEALGAQLYLTVTVARLVGLHAQARRDPPAGTGEAT